MAFFSKMIAPFKKAYHIFCDTCYGIGRADVSLYDALGIKFPGVPGFIVRAISWLLVYPLTFVLAFVPAFMLAIYNHRSYEGFRVTLGYMFSFPHNVAETLYLHLAHGIRELGILCKLVDPPIRGVVIQLGGLMLDAPQQDLNQLAENRESSVASLSQAEQDCLAEAKKVYEPKVQEAGGEEVVLTRLRQHLERAYCLQPASIMRKGKALILPAAWSDFQKLKLSREERQQALAAYHCHPHHTALRYISVPNFWMSPRAIWVRRNDTYTEFRSQFENYKSLIAMLYLATQDDSVPNTNGMTTQGRFDNFARELGLIGRAHNWDNKRQVGDKTVEYDDGEGDKPSCAMGMFRRLYQSVIAHPLFDILTKDTLQQDIRGFVFNHYSQALAKADKRQVSMALDIQVGAEDTCEFKSEDPSITPASVLKALDIPPESQQAFKESLVRKYGDRLNSNQAMQAILNEAFKLDACYTSHLTRYYESANLKSLLQAPKLSEKSSANPASSASEEKVQDDAPDITLDQLKQVYRKHHGGFYAQCRLFTKHATVDSVILKLNRRAFNSSKVNSASRSTLAELNLPVPNRMSCN